jgi:hypothetical protein
VRNRGQQAIDAVSWLRSYVTTVGRDSMIHELPFLQRAPEQQRRMWSAIGQAIEPMLTRLSERGPASIDLNTKLALAGLAADETIPVLKELGINLPAWRRAALRNDYEHLLEFLIGQVSNTAGAGDLTALSATSSSDDHHGPWLKLQRRIAYIETRLRKGQDIPDESFEEVFPARGQPRRGIRLSDVQIAQLLGLPHAAFATLKTMQPSPAALNELCKVTGYKDASTQRRTEDHEHRSAVAALSARRIPEADLQRLDQEKQDEHFENLRRKLERTKLRRDE